MDGFMNYKSITLFFVAATFVGCATHSAVQDGTIVWEDDDRRPIEKPEEYYSPKVWDAADHTAFRPITRALLVEELGPARNVNALGEVPNSSWYSNRMSLADISPEAVANGPCGKMIDLDAKWIVKSGKFGGYNPGFRIEDTSDGRNYLLKFDRPGQRERPTAADVIGSKVYWAAGFSVPCNEVIYFTPENLKIEDGAVKESAVGDEAPLEWSDLEFAWRGAPRDDGKVRATASLFLEGEPLGPFTYEGTRDDDPNDVIPHEDRRELRGSRVIAAWVNHFDAREANTLDMFIKDGDSELGYVQHNILDFGDTLGSLWEWDPMSRRLGHSFYFDPKHVAVDFVTLGAVKRPWEDLSLHPIFGYFDAASFEPDRWKPGYPNPAFARMDDEDAYWGARIMSRFTDEHVEALVDKGRFTNPEHAAYLEKTLRIRRDKIVNLYMRRVTPLDEPRLADGALCVDDLLARGGWVGTENSTYQTSIGDEDWTEVRPDGNTVCVDLAQARAAGEDVTLAMRIKRFDQDRFATPVTFTLRNAGGTWQVVGIARR